MEGQQAFLMQMQMMQVKRMMATRPPSSSLEGGFGQVVGFFLTWLLAGRGGCRGPEIQRLVLQLSSFGFTSRMFMLFFSANSSKCEVVLLPFSNGIVGSLLEERGMA